MLTASQVDKSKIANKCIYYSAGVGRTGVFITLSTVLERMQYEGVVDVFQTVRTLRTQRPAMVQTEVAILLLVRRLSGNKSYANCLDASS